MGLLVGLREVSVSFDPLLCFENRKEQTTPFSIIINNTPVSNTPGCPSCVVISICKLTTVSSPHTTQWFMGP